MYKKNNIKQYVCKKYWEIGYLINIYANCD